MIGAIVVCSAGAYALRADSVCGLTSVEIDGDSTAYALEDLGLTLNRSLLSQPLEVATETLLDDPEVAKVEVSLVLPDEISIRTNQFEIACFLLDKQSGLIDGLDHRGRSVPLPDQYDDWEHPVITGAAAGKLFEYNPDARVSLVVQQLEQLREDNARLYRLIDEVSLTHDEYAVMILAGLPYKLKLDPMRLHAQVVRYVKFIENYELNVTEAEVLDLRHDNLIVQVGGV